MKRLVCLAVVSALLIGGGYAVYKYSGARGKVAKKELLDKIDGWLGKEEVRRQEIEDKIEGMKKGIATLSDARIRVGVQAKMLKDEIATNDKNLKSSAEVLTQMKKDLESFKTKAEFSVRYGGKDYTKEDDLDKLATKLIDRHKKLKSQTEAMKERLTKYEDNHAILVTREEDAKKKLAEFKHELSQLDADITLLKAQRQAAEALNEADKNFGESVEGLEEKIKELKVLTKTAVAKEDEKWKEISAKTEVEDATKIITNSKDTVREIDDLLGNK
jgi:phage shock protein A